MHDLSYCKGQVDPRECAIFATMAPKRAAFFSTLINLPRPQVISAAHDMIVLLKQCLKSADLLTLSSDRCSSR